MFKKILTKLALATTRISFGLLVMKSKLSPGATVEYTLDVKMTSGLLAGKHYSGSFSYKASAIKGKGFETVKLKDNFKLNLKFLQTSYTETDDVAFPNSNAQFLHFFNGQILGLYYVAKSADTSAPSFSFFEHDFNSKDFGQGSVTYTRSSSSLSAIQPALKTSIIDGTLGAGRG